MIANLVARTKVLLRRFHLEEDGWTVRVVRIGFDSDPNCKGYCDHVRREILLTPDVNFAICLHEVAHCLTPGAGHKAEFQQCFRDLCSEYGGEHRWTGSTLLPWTPWPQGSTVEKSDPDNTPS